MHALKSLPHYSYEDYLLWEGRWELIDGIPYAMSPAATPRHQNIAGNIHAEFRRALKKDGCIDCKVYQPIDYKIDEYTVVQPDLLIVCKPIKKKFLDFPPSLVVEILSDSTKDKDREVKYSLFEKEGIHNYLIVDPEKETVEIYQLLNKKYSLLKSIHDEAYTFGITNCEANVVFKEIW